jgi:hypothetical protein
MEPPSIAPDREGEAAAPSPPPRPRPQPAAKPKAKPAAKASSSRLALFAVGGIALAAAAWFGFRTFLAAAPTVASVSPPRSEPGQTVSISGQGFDTSAARNKVRFGDREAQITSASDELLAVTIPADLAVGDAPIVVERGGKKSAPFPFKVYRAPRVTGLEPDVAMSGEEILIKGQNLDGKPLTVKIGGEPAEVKEAVPASVRVVVPALKVPQGKPVSVNVQVGADSAKPADLTVGYLPLVVEAKPERGQAGDIVVIKGRGFDADPEDNEVYFANQPALILAASETELRVAAPASPIVDAPLVTAQVHVKANGAISSSPVMFSQLRPSASTFVLRFYAAAVLAHPQFALVSTDLAPVMVLGGVETDVARTAARAVEVANALNQLAEGAVSDLPVFEVREQPETAVCVKGRVAPVASVTAEDAAAYELPFEPGAKARRPTVKGLAAYWAALLQDYFALFVKKQRPVAALALSPRARVLSDLYAAAQRVPGTTTVPLSVVRPLSPAMARGLREMALFVPAEKDRQLNVAVEGQWTGTMEEGTEGSRPIRVRFAQRAGKLSGTLTSRSGKVELNTPLRDVTFQRNEVRFQVDLQGAARTFSGTLSGGTLSGTIAKGGDKAAGHFTLTYVD